MKKIISVNKLNVTIKNKKILNNISFDIFEGEFICITGPNGSGKSTLFSVLDRLENNQMIVNYNSILLNEKNIADYKRESIAKQIALMTQNESSVWNYTVEEYIQLARYVYGYENEKLKEYLYNLFNIDEIKNCSINQLSGGEFQRVRIVRTLYQETSVVLFDEPISNLDIDYQYLLLKNLKQYSKKFNVTILLSIHDLNLAAAFSERIIIVSKNIEKQIFDGKPDEVFTNENLKKIYNTDLQIYFHPVLKCVQVCTSIEMNFAKEENNNE